jgi:hypothetical protein
MTSALFTRETLARIRTQATSCQAPDIAAELGWELARLRRVAAAHGIELSGAHPAVNIPADEILKKARERKPAPVIAPEAALVDRTIKQLIDALPPRQAQVLAVLASVQDGAYVTAMDIAKHIGIVVTREAITEAVDRIRRALRFDRSNWAIEGRQRAGGGYRLVTLRHE